MSEEVLVPINTLKNYLTFQCYNDIAECQQTLNLIGSSRSFIGSFLLLTITVSPALILFKIFIP